MSTSERLDLPAAGSRRVLPRLRWKWFAAIVVALLLIAAVTLQVVLLRSHPVAHGSSSSSLGVLDKCPEFSPATDDVRCVTVPFVSGGPVGTGFSVRNTGSFPLTIESVGDFGAESDIMLAQMHAVLPNDPDTFSLDDMRPFEPVTLGPGEEVTVQFMGNMRQCADMLPYWARGSALIATHARLTVRWLLMTTEVDIPLQQQLRIEAPTSCRN